MMNKVTRIVAEMMVGVVVCSLSVVSLAEGIARGTVPEGAEREFEDRIPIKAEINGAPVWLIFDTGSERTTLFTHAADRIGLKYRPATSTSPPQPGKVRGGISERCDMTIFGKTVRTTFAVIDLAVPTKIDGVLAWNSIKRSVIELRADDKTLTISDSLPTLTEDWVAFTIPGDSELLAVEIDRPGGAKGTAYIDTGDPGGVQLSPGRWREWLRGVRSRPVTLEGAYVPADGFVVRKLGWARELRLGAISLADVPVQKCTAQWGRLDNNYDATLGLFALTRLNMVIDGGAGKVYIKPNASARSEYEYNRMGAVFIPADTKSDELLAHVMVGSPAYEAGIRDGDQLLRIGDIDVTGWKSNPSIMPLNQYWVAPAGTEVRLTISRKRTRIEIVVVLEDILSGDMKQGE